MTAPTPNNPLPNGSDISLPWHLRLPRSLEKDFRLYFRASVAKVAPWAMGLLALLLLLAMVSEYLIDPNILMVSWRPRLLTLMLIGGYLFLLRKPQWHQWLHPASLLLAFVIAFTGNYLGMRVNHPLSYAFFLQTPMAILMICILVRVPFYAALASALVMIGALEVSTLHNLQGPPFQSLVLLVLTITLSGMSLFGQYVYERLLRQHFLSEHVLYQHRSELHSANLVLESQATIDGLTGCINRRGMESKLNNLFHQMKNRSADAPEHINLMLFDIDFFKQYNDTYGHPAGDECLKRVSAVPQGMVQSDTDFVARYGGEEFVITLTGSSFNDALVFAERMRNRVEQLGLPHSGSRVSQV
ncbi:MAG: GGDEF domain-containing protein, partial [Alcanivorax sp.]|nr:GGDEF domain-containing protein [Alcanivorax sp.]